MLTSRSAMPRSKVALTSRATRSSIVCHEITYSFITIAKCSIVRTVKSKDLLPVNSFSTECISR